MKRLALVTVVGLLAVTPAACDDCHGSLKDLGSSCPATFDGTFDQLSCRPYSTQRTFACDDLIGFSEVGYAGVTCVYDASSHSLVGAEHWSDIPDNGCVIRTAGKVPTLSCYERATYQNRTCPAANTSAD
ncbi:MAG: hypothetical protein QOI66_571 [Myxococcales bacterium]|jgi:hypothetical protein|nr:hypothetical protein [Myxococcales bacterium]